MMQLTPVGGARHVEDAMLTLLGFGTIVVLLALLLSNRVTAVVALIAVPVASAALAGFSAGEISDFVAEGITGVASTAAMFVFAILYFGVMRDAGLFQPVVERVLRFAGHNPVTIAIGTVLLAMATHLDGAGATTFLITIPALLPLYDELGMRRLVLAALTGLGAGIMNMVPWGGPGVRASSVVEVGANELWVPLIPGQLAGMVACVAIAYFLGRRERTRIVRTADVPAGVGGTATTSASVPRPEDPDPELLRPRLFWVNAALTVAAVATLVWGVVPPELVFMLALVVALVINYPGMSSQTDRINAHAQGAILMASTLLAAGVFLGVMENSGMIEAMADALTSAVPASAGPGLPLLVGVLGVPLSLLFGPDAYYFGVLPVLNSVGAAFGVPSLDLAQASLAGQETVGFAVSPLTGSFYLLTGLSGVSIGAHIRFLLPWAWLVSLVVLAVAVLTGVVPLWSG